jgi:hypothetical protein
MNRNVHPARGSRYGYYPQTRRAQTSPQGGHGEGPDPRFGLRANEATLERPNNIRAR